MPGAADVIDPRFRGRGVGWCLKGIALAWFALAITIATAGAQTCGAPGPAPYMEITICSKAIAAGKLSGNELANAYNNRGNAYWKNGDRELALQDYDAATRVYPRYAPAFANRGLYYREKGDLERSLQEFDQAIRLDPNSGPFRVQRGTAHRMKGNIDAAVADFDAAVRLTPKDADAYYQRGIAYRIKGNFDAAIADNDIAVRLLPTSANVHYERGFTYFLKHDNDKANSSLTRALELNPNYAAALVLRAKVYQNQGAFDRAIEDLDRALQIDPKFALAYEVRGSTYNSKNDLDHAIADFNTAIALRPTPGGYGGRGFAISRKGDNAGSLVDFDKAISLGTTDPIIFVDRAVGRRRAGNVDGALADFSEAIRLNAQYVTAYTARGQAYEAKGDRVAARRDYAAALQLPASGDQDKTSQNTARARIAVLDSAMLSGGTPPAVVPPPVVVPTPANLPKPAPTDVPGRKIALVLGNSAYQIRPLTNPVKDAQAISATLRRIGFTVVDGFDLDYAGMRRIISQFLVQAATAQLVVVYYAGHGIQVQGRNYLIPVDAKLSSIRTANFDLFDVDQVIAPLDDHSHATIIILDACRNNPLATQTAGGRGLDPGNGLAGYSGVSDGMLIAFATGPGKVAEDGSGEHSPFTGALLKYIETPNLEVLELFRMVRQAVIAETKRAQVPWEQNSLVGNVYLVAGNSGPPK